MQCRSNPSPASSAIEQLFAPRCPRNRARRAVSLRNPNRRWFSRPWTREAGSRAAMTRGMVKFSRQRLLGNVEPKTFPSPLEPAVVSPFSSSPTSPVSLSFLRHLPPRSLLFCYPTERVSLHPPRGSFLLSYPLAVTDKARVGHSALSSSVSLCVSSSPSRRNPVSSTEPRVQRLQRRADLVAFAER